MYHRIHIYFFLLNSLPLGATWMAWGATGPPEQLTVSSFSRGLPPLDGQGGGAEEEAGDSARGLELEPWERLMEPISVKVCIRES